MLELVGLMAEKLPNNGKHTRKIRRNHGTIELNCQNW